MKAFWRKSLGLALLFPAADEAWCQIDLTRYEIGFTAGVFVYQGDLTPNPLGAYRTLKPAFNLIVNKKLNPVYSLRGSLFYGGLSGSDAAYSYPSWRKQRAFTFSSKTLELSGLLIYHPIGTEHKCYPYVLGGAGLSLVNIRRDWSGFNADYFAAEKLDARLAADAGQRLPRMIAVLPVGLGIRYTLTERLSLTAGTIYRLTRTDYLDGFSQAADPDLYDHYQSHTVGIVYSFGRKANLDCPPIVR